MSCNALRDGGGCARRQERGRARKLALAQRDRNQLDLTKETLLKALALAPQSPAAHYNLAQSYDQTHEATAAIEHYRRFLDIAGAEHSRRAAAVRARIAELSRTPE